MMERLTIRNSDGSVSQPTDLNWAEALEKLAAYEDTGLTPDYAKLLFEEMSKIRWELGPVTHAQLEELGRVLNSERGVILTTHIHGDTRRGHMVVGGHGQTHWYECSECKTVVSPGWKCCPVCEVKFYETDSV